MRRDYLTRLKGSIVHAMTMRELDKPDIVKCNKTILCIDRILVGKIKKDIPAYILSCAKMLEYSNDKKLREVGSIFKQMYDDMIEEKTE